MKKRLWLLALLTLILLGVVIRYRRAPAASPAPPSTPPAPPVAPPVPVPAKAAPKAEPEAPEPPKPKDERGAGLKEKGESLFGGEKR